MTQRADILMDFYLLTYGMSTALVI